MFKHAFTTQSAKSGFGTVFSCKGCQDPEPDTCDFVWVDSDGTVIFDPSDPKNGEAVVDALFAFLARHDAFGLTSPEFVKQRATAFA